MKNKKIDKERRCFDYGVVMPERRGVKYLKPEELKVGYLYEIDARNADFGIWMGSDYGEFLISRYKCGDNFLFEEIHVDLSDSYGTVKPLKEIAKTPFDMAKFKFSHNEDDEVLEFLNGWKKYWDCPLCGEKTYNPERILICDKCVKEYKEREYWNCPLCGEKVFDYKRLICDKCIKKEK